MLILVTGATGKVGRHFIAALLDDARFSKLRVRALCHNRLRDETDRVEVITGSIAERQSRPRRCRRHPCRASRDLQGNARRRHGRNGQRAFLAARGVSAEPDRPSVHPHRRRCRDRPFLLSPRQADYRRCAAQAYPGSYALSKVLEEVMLEQFGIQYDTNGCCLRAPWIMEKDDFKYTLSFGDDVFGGPDWKTLVPEADAKRYAKEGTVPLLRDADGHPLKRNFVHVDDLVSAILAALDNPRAKRQLFNICMDRPVDYGEVAAYLARTRGLDSIDIPSRFHSNWMDNSKAKYLLDWQPGYDLEMLIDSAWRYERSPTDPRIVWYPG